MIQKEIENDYRGSQGSERVGEWVVVSRCQKSIILSIQTVYYVVMRDRNECFFEVHALIRITIFAPDDILEE